MERSFADRLPKQVKRGAVLFEPPGHHGQFVVRPGPPQPGTENFGEFLLRTLFWRQRIQQTLVELVTLDVRLEKRFRIFIGHVGLQGVGVQTELLAYSGEVRRFALGITAEVSHQEPITILIGRNVLRADRLPDCHEVVHLPTV